MAIVEHRGQKRKARGYTMKEIVEAGLTIEDLQKLRVQIDPRRKTKYPENVKELKALKK
jgi:ribosomal protein L13E